jgi:formamidopyrimidine-DNA glycosylase
MPELPEVQTIINTLKTSGLLHKQITNVSVYKTKLLKNSTLIKFKKFLIGESINNITRIGKYLIFHITHNKTLVVHLRMEGKLFYEPASSSISHIHLRIKFDLKNHHKLYYYDSRIFGTFHIYEGQEYLNASHLTKLALDPLDAGFN